VLTPLPFRQHKELEAVGEEGDRAWRALLPPNARKKMWDGVVFVPLNETYSLA
jgi:hypothetical protein